MADKTHVEHAGWAIGGWNRWRDEHPDLVPDLSGADLSAGLYRNGNFRAANLTGTDFRRSNMRGADLREALMEGADLSKTVLVGAQLAGARLAGAEFAKANLSGADLTGADLSGVDLEKADLAGAQLGDAVLAGARLGKADLSTVVGLTQGQLESAVGDTTTELPQGLTRPASWASAVDAGITG